MVKIRDLSNKQIVQQLQKYFKFITALDAERQKRIEQGAPEEELFTAEELEAKRIAEVSRIRKLEEGGEEEPAAAESTTIFHLKMDDNQLDEIAEKADAQAASRQPGGTNQQYSVSQLIEMEKDKSSAPSPMKEIESDVTSHNLDLAPKKPRKRVLKKNKPE